MQRHDQFHNRREAGRMLADVLSFLKDDSPIVLALPRGGVPVAFEVAAALQAPMDVLLVRKIGVPGHEELALGAVVEGDDPEVVINDEVAAVVGVSDSEVEAGKWRQIEEIERRRETYRRGEPRLDVRGRTVIVVDDGIATGATVKAALRSVRANRPARLILAVPVAPAEAIAALKSDCDEIVCLETPEPFHAVGLHYLDFGQTTDEEVINLLAKAGRMATSDPLHRRSVGRPRRGRA